MMTGRERVLSPAFFVGHGCGNVGQLTGLYAPAWGSDGGLSRKLADHYFQRREAPSYFSRALAPASLFFFPMEETPAFKGAGHADMGKRSIFSLFPLLIVIDAMI